MRTNNFDMIVVSEQHDPCGGLLGDEVLCQSSHCGRDLAPVVGSRRHTERANSVYKYLTSLVELTSQQVPVIWMDGYLSVCFFNLCCQPERDLSRL